MYDLIKLYLNINCKKKKGFELNALENFIIEKCGGQSSYYEHGGYEALYKSMEKLKKEGVIKEIKSSKSNMARTPMKLRWTLVSDKEESKWKDEDIFRVSDILNLNTYIKYPKYQNEKEWEYITKVHSFLKEREKREWASIEERCLELFGDEKFLTDNDNGKESNKVLKRLGLTYEDILAREYGEQFIYWNKGVSNIKTIIILENHSTFFSFKRAVQNKMSIFNLEPDALIFGAGKKIIKSFSFIDEIAIPENINVYYFGDMDPDGYFIYGDLVEKYPNINISLLTEAYVHLLNLCKRNYPCKKQIKNDIYLNYIIEEFSKKNYGDYIDNLKALWKSNFRIPQELITYEYLLNLKGEYA